MRICFRIRYSQVVIKVVFAVRFIALWVWRARVFNRLRELKNLSDHSERFFVALSKASRNFPSACRPDSP
jgi:hypothetical protein